MPIYSFEGSRDNYPDYVQQAETIMRSKEKRTNSSRDGLSTHDCDFLFDSYRNVNSNVNSMVTGSYIINHPKWWGGGYGLGLISLGNTVL